MKQFDIFMDTFFSGYMPSFHKKQLICPRATFLTPFNIWWGY